MGCMSTEVKQDPAVGRAQEMNAQIGMRAQDLAERNFDWNQKLTEQFSPTTRRCSRTRWARPQRTPSAATINGTNTRTCSSRSKTRWPKTP